ncbi:hypothetical protein GCM10027075_77000 [Streptomyces heilongjiangensis]
MCRRCRKRHETERLRERLRQERAQYAESVRRERMEAHYAAREAVARLTRGRQTPPSGKALRPPAPGPLRELGPGWWDAASGDRW